MKRTGASTCTTADMTVADMVRAVTTPPLPVRITAYDGSAVGPRSSGLELHVVSPHAFSYMVTAPGELGLARAYIMGKVAMRGVKPGNPYKAFDRLEQLKARVRRPSAGSLGRILIALGRSGIHRPEIPEVETPPAWRRALSGTRSHTQQGDKGAVTSHYDRSNRFYSMVLGPLMTYTCALFTDPGDSLEDAQANKIRLVLDKLDLAPGGRLLDIGCGWGSVLVAAARRGIRAIGVTLSEPQARWANDWIAREGLSDLAEARVMDYRQVPERGFDAICSLGMMEHVGVRHYDEYFSTMFSLLRPGGRLLNHQITRRDSTQPNRAGAFIGRYVFPDGELAAPGLVMGRLHDAGFEVVHEENLRQHYALTLEHWCRNLQEHWSAAVESAGSQTSLLWGLYMAGARWNFERNNIQIHQLLAVRPGPDRDGHWYPLRPWWDA